jgi:hypothetical protein
VSTLLLKAFRFWGNGYEIQCGPIYWDFYCFCHPNPLPAPKSSQKEEKNLLKKFKKLNLKKLNR